MPQKQHHNVLVLLQGRNLQDHPGVVDAFYRLQNEGVIGKCSIVPIHGMAEGIGWSETWVNLARTFLEDRYDVVFFHHFHGGGLTVPHRLVETLYTADPKPIILLSCGDGFSADWMMPDYPAPFRYMVKHADVVFSTQLGAAVKKFRKWGAKRVVLLPLAMCQKRFRLNVDSRGSGRKEYDIVIVGSRNQPRLNPLSHYWHNARKRVKVVSVLTREFGNRFAIFGNGWDGHPCAKGPVPFERQSEVMQTAKLVVDGYMFSKADFYLSNRPFIAIGTGATMVSFAVPFIETLLEPDRHWFLCENVEAIGERCRKLIELGDEALSAVGLAGAAHVKAYHTQYHRIRFVVETAQSMIVARRDKRPLPPPRVPWFLPSSDSPELQAKAVPLWES